MLDPNVYEQVCHTVMKRLKGIFPLAKIRDESSYSEIAEHPCWGLSIRTDYDSYSQINNYLGSQDWENFRQGLMNECKTVFFLDLGNDMPDLLPACAGDFVLVYQEYSPIEDSPVAIVSSVLVDPDTNQRYYKYQYISFSTCKQTKSYGDTVYLSKNEEYPVSGFLKVFHQKEDVMRHLKNQAKVVYETERLFLEAEEKRTDEDIEGVVNYLSKVKVIPTTSIVAPQYIY